MNDYKITNGIYLLLLVMRNPIHGYGAAKKVAEISNGKFIIPPGTLYGILDKMTKGNLISVYGEEMVGNKKKILYKITEKGELILNQKILEIKHLYELTIYLMEDNDD